MSSDIALTDLCVLLEVSPISTQDLWSSTRITIRFLPTSSPWIALFGQAAAQGKALVVPDFFYFGNIHCSTAFHSLPQICTSTQSCLWAHEALPSPHGLVFALIMHCLLWDLMLTTDGLYHIWAPINVIVMVEKFLFQKKEQVIFTVAVFHSIAAVQKKRPCFFDKANLAKTVAEYDIFLLDGRLLTPVWDLGGIGSLFSAFDPFHLSCCWSRVDIAWSIILLHLQLSSLGI